MFRAVLIDSGQGGTVGTWGPGAFENDTALDWLMDLDKAEDTAFLAETLEPAADPEGLQDPYDCEVGLAAAEVVAVLKGAPGPGLPEEVRDWVARHPDGASPELVELAMGVVRGVREDSELRAMWEEPGNPGPWLDATNDLLRRLES
jgi:Domain of unknown function (DUF4259)